MDTELSGDKSGKARMYAGYIGVFDSGVGGISVLQALRAELPGEDMVYLGDSANAPYGEKSTEEILTLTDRCCDRLVHAGVKALVVACNTATSVAIRDLRQKYESRLPVIGTEPAIRPAAEAFPHGKILVMATPATLKLEKYARLSHELSGEAEFIPVACPGLAGRIEKGNLDAPDLEHLLRSFLSPYIGQVDAIVLGCTHYPFIRKQIRRVMGDVPLFDGGAGIARQLHRMLEERHLLSGKNEGQLIFLSTLDAPDEIDLYRQMYSLPASAV